MISPGTLWAVVIAAIGLILTLLNIVDKITTFAARAKEPDKLQDERIGKLESGLADLNRRFEERGEKYDGYFSNDRERLDAIEHNARAANTTIIRSLQALTVHALDGNNVESLKESKKELDEYLLNR